MRKRLMGLAALACALCLVLAGCGNKGADKARDKDSWSEAFAGVWELSGGVSNGEEVGQEDLDLAKKYGLNSFFVLNGDGSATVNMYGIEVGGTWEASSATEAKVTLVNDLVLDEDLTAEDAQDGVVDKTDEQETMEVELVLEDDQLVLSLDEDASTMTFARTTQEAMDEYLQSTGSLADLWDELDQDELLSDLGGGSAEDQGE